MVSSAGTHPLAVPHSRCPSPGGQPGSAPALPSALQPRLHRPLQARVRHWSRARLVVSLSCGWLLPITQAFWGKDGLPLLLLLPFWGGVFLPMALVLHSWWHSRPAAHHVCAAPWRRVAPHEMRLPTSAGQPKGPLSRCVVDAVCGVAAAAGWCVGSCAGQRRHTRARALRQCAGWRGEAWREGLGVMHVHAKLRPGWQRPPRATRRSVLGTMLLCQRKALQALGLTAPTAPKNGRGERPAPCAPGAVAGRCSQPTGCGRRGGARQRSQSHTQEKGAAMRGADVKSAGRRAEGPR